jgi:hypothetical protein
VSFKANVTGVWKVMTWNVGKLLVLTILRTDGVIESLPRYVARNISTGSAGGAWEFSIVDVQKSDTGPVVCTIQGPIGSKTATLQVKGTTTTNNDEFKTADKVECIGFLLGGGRQRFAAWPGPSPLPVMAVQFYQIKEEISSEAKNEMNCDSESGYPALIPGKNHPSGAQGFPLFQVTSLRPCTQDPIATNKAGPFLPHPGVECEGQFDRCLTCPALSYYHLRGFAER